MIVKPRIWGFICTTAHPQGCELNVREQVAVARAAGKGPALPGPKRVLVIGASTGYGLAARITAAFGFGAATLGVFFEKPGKPNKTGTAGWYNSAAFDRAAREAGLVSLSLNGDAFSEGARERAIALIREKLGGPVDLVIYSLASPLKRLPDGGTAHTALKPVGAPYAGRTIDTDKDQLAEVRVEPATQQEIDETVAVMGGTDWALWLDALYKAGVMGEGARSVAFSYVGPEVTWPIYWHGTIGHAKQHLERTAAELRARHPGLEARIAILKSIVTQASAAIPVIPLYVSIVFKVMKRMGLHEGAIEQMQRLFHEVLYRADGALPTDAEGRLRLDDRELRADVQEACKQLWPQVTDANLMQLTDYAGYKHDFLKQFGFERSDVDYEADVQPQVDFDCATP
ncbi:MAG TPA: enoyl-ACP reductase FabV [Gammaproteobacteria bacterium]|nr:enoyl-ACP reductase FabV [Gammaproteobacteria bacterium]